MINTRLERTATTALFWTMVLLSFALVFAVAVLPNIRRGMLLEAKLGELRRTNGLLRQRVTTLETEKWALQNDPFFVEKLARRMLYLQRPGERRVTSVTPKYDTHEARRAELPVGVPPSVLTDVCGRLEPLATNAAVRLTAVMLALVNLLVAFSFFGQSPFQPAEPRRSLPILTRT